MTKEVISEKRREVLGTSALATSLVWVSIVAASASAQEISITRSGSRPSQVAPAEQFTGSVRVEPLFDDNGPSRMIGSSVTFEPGARTAWHTHPLGQVLIVTAGTGRVQKWGGPIDEIRPGDVVRIPPNLKHWHGATDNRSMTHVALLEHLDGKRVEWMEKVTDAQFGAPSSTKEEQDVLSLSKDKWRWMSERNVDALTALFHEKAVFVHMGGTMSKSQELDVIGSGGIQYKHAEILEASVQLIGATAIVLNRIRLVAVVGGNEVTNPFVVTEVYVQEGETRKLASLSFTRLLTPQ